MDAQAPSEVIQIVGREPGKDRVFNKQSLERLIVNYGDDKNTHYAVFSIIGAQSSGKSTLMNYLFGTAFHVMDAKKGRQATTKGIWAAIYKKHRTVVLDVEGSDGAEHQEDEGFENQSALFALLVSDVIFVNIGINDIGRLNGGSIPLLHRIFQERINHDKHNTVLIFTVRDYDGETPVGALRESLTSEVQKIYSQFPKEEGATLRRCIELHFEFFRHKRYEMQEFKNNCTEMLHRITRNEFVRDGQNKWTIHAFPTIAESLWNDILQNKRLDMASYWNIASQQCCTVIMSQKLSSLKSNQDYLSLTNDDLRDPGVFCKRLDKILNFILSEYDKDAQRYNREAAQDVKETLRAKILNDATAAFMKTLDKFKDAFLESTAKEIEKAFMQNPLEDTYSIFQNYSLEFERYIKDLNKYNDIVKLCQHGTKQDLKLRIKMIHDKALLIQSRKCCKEIMAQKLSSLKSEKDYVSLKTEDLRNPKEFCKRLGKILNSILSEYDKEAQGYNREDAEDVKQVLTTEILKVTKGSFEQTLNHFVTGFLKDTADKIKPKLKKNLFEDMETIVMENKARFWQETEDVDLYKDVVTERHQEIEENLKLLTKSIRNKAVLSFVGRYSVNFTMIGLELVAAVNGFPIPIIWL